jgi:hypothetical protein
MPPLQLARHVATRYVQPLREGGSLPAVVDTESGGLLVVKFRGAGQGAKVLVAELIVGLLAETLELPVPELALVEVSDRFGRSEPDPEIQELLRRSHGTNVGRATSRVRSTSTAPPPVTSSIPSSRRASSGSTRSRPIPIARRTTPICSSGSAVPWLIDHGAALYAHHEWSSVDDARTVTSFPLIRSHVLLAAAGDLAAADADCAARITPM